jgi:hypothetical protein
MAIYIRLTDYKSSDEKEQEFFNPENRYEAKQKDFKKIPNNPIAYWISPSIKDIFSRGQKTSDIGFTKGGMGTSDNNRFLKYWMEVDNLNISFNSENIEEAQLSLKKWFPYNKGGSTRRWYGNNEYLINWENDGEEVKAYAAKLYKSFSRTVKNIDSFFLEGLTWSSLSSGNFSLRYCDKGFIFDSKGSMYFLLKKNNILYTLGFLNGKITQN